MKPIHINVRGPKEKAGNVDFSSRQKDEWYLSNGDPGRSESHTFPVVCILDDRPSCQKQSNDSPVCDDDQQRTQRWRTEPGQIWMSEAYHPRIVYLSRNCDCCRIYLRYQISGSSWVRNGEFVVCPFPLGKGKSASISKVVAKKRAVAMLHGMEDADRDHVSSALRPLRRHMKTKTAATRYQYMRANI